MWPLLEEGNCPFQNKERLAGFHGATWHLNNKKFAIVPSECIGFGAEGTPYFELGSALGYAVIAISKENFCTILEGALFAHSDFAKTKCCSLKLLLYLILGELAVWHFKRLLGIADAPGKHVATVSEREGLPDLMSRIAGPAPKR